jgi:segregation and condensation protein A
MARDAQDMLARPASAFAPASERPLKHVDRIELWNSFNLVLRRLAEKLVVGQIHAEQVTVADQMEYILGHLKTRREFTFSSLFPEKISLRKLVATFLAMLELTRLRKLTLRQDEAFADIHCTAVDENTPVIPLVPDEPAPVEAAPAPAASAGQIALETPAEPSTVTPHHEKDAPPPPV